MAEKLTNRWKTLLVWVVSIGLAAAAGSVLTRAQTPAQVQVLPRTTGQNDGVVLSGNDFGFRVERSANGEVYGTPVVRVNGQWVEARMQPKLSRASQ